MPHVYSKMLTPPWKHVGLLCRLNALSDAGQNAKSRARTAPTQIQHLSGHNGDG